MNEQQFSAIKWYFVSFITFSIWSLLLWQYSHGGVPSHYFLQRADMPELSNWWGALLLPVLTWLAMARIQKRLFMPATTPATKDIRLLTIQVLLSFIIALCYGAILSLAFFTGNAAVSAVMFPAILFFALFFRVYRAEFILGLILGMSITFGAVLPTIFATLIALASAVVYFSVRFIYAQIKNITANKQVS